MFRFSSDGADANSPDFRPAVVKNAHTTAVDMPMLEDHSSVFSMATGIALAPAEKSPAPVIPPPDAMPHAGRVEFSPEMAGKDVTPLNLEFDQHHHHSNGRSAGNPLSGTCGASIQFRPSRESRSCRSQFPLLFLLHCFFFALFASYFLFLEPVARIISLMLRRPWP